MELELKIGQEYFLRMETRTGVQVNAPRISVVPNEEGRYDVKQMKYIKDEDIKDRSKVIIPNKDKDLNRLKSSRTDEIHFTSSVYLFITI